MRRLYHGAAPMGDETNEEEGNADRTRTITALQRRFSLFYVGVHKLQACCSEVEKRTVPGHPTFNDKIGAAVAIYCGKEFHDAIRQDRETDVADCRTRQRSAKEVTCLFVAVWKILRNTDKFIGATAAAAVATPMPEPADGVLNEDGIDALDAADAARFRKRTQDSKAAKRDRAEDIADARSADQAADEARWCDAAANRALDSLANSSDRRNALTFYMSATMQGSPASAMWIAQQVSMYLGAEEAAATGYVPTAGGPAAGGAAAAIAHAAGAATAEAAAAAVAAGGASAVRSSGTSSERGGSDGSRKSRLLSPHAPPPSTPSAYIDDDDVGVFVAGPVNSPAAVADGPALQLPHAAGALLIANGQQPPVPVSLAPRGLAVTASMRAAASPGVWWEQTRNIPTKLMPDVNALPVMREPARRQLLSPAAAPADPAAPLPSPGATEVAPDAGIRYLPWTDMVPDDLSHYRALVANPSDSDGKYEKVRTKRSSPTSSMTRTSRHDHLMMLCCPHGLSFC